MAFVTVAGLRLKGFDRLHLTWLRISGVSYIRKEKRMHFSKDNLNNYARLIRIQMTSEIFVHAFQEVAFDNSFPRLLRVLEGKYKITCC